MKPHGEPHRTNLRRGKAPVTALDVAHNRKAGVAAFWKDLRHRAGRRKRRMGLRELVEP